MRRPPHAWAAAAALGAALVVAAPALARAQTPEPPPPSERDGARVLGRLGLGTFRRITFELGRDRESIPVDAVGLRYWFDGDGPGMARAWGVDLGLAFAYRRDTEELAGDKQRSVSAAMGIHAGLPLVLAQLPHANFELVPEVDVVLLTGERAGLDLSGLAVNAGVRAGFEVFFGFVGLADLSLEASVGVGLAHARTRLERDGRTESTLSTTFVGFQKLADPWDIFRSSVAARYYF